MPTPNAARETVERFRQDLTALAGPLESAGPLGIAVSGGPDSLALLLLAHGALPGRIFAATVNHGLRPEAAHEATMVANLCATIGVPHATLASNDPIASDSNVQERARILRYRLLARWAHAQGLTMVATGHHLDDVAESFLMRTLRGSGVSGLARMKARALLPYDTGNAVTLLRPLLDWRRAELAGIVADSGLHAADDPSNRDTRYDRVRIRTLLADQPPLDPVAMARVAGNLSDADAAIEWITDLSWRGRLEEQSATSIRLDPHDLPREIRRRLAGRAVAALDSQWNGEGLDRFVAALDGGDSATLGRVKATGGPNWQFGIARARRGPR